MNTESAVCICGHAKTLKDHCDPFLYSVIKSRFTANVYCKLFHCTRELTQDKSKLVTTFHHVGRWRTKLDAIT